MNVLHFSTTIVRRADLFRKILPFSIVILYVRKVVVSTTEIHCLGEVQLHSPSSLPKSPYRF